MPRISRVLLPSFLLLVCVATASRAGPFSALYVFGDSLSDVGNLDDISFGIYPGPTYFDGRVSNGPVFVEMLSAELGLGPMAASRNGGTNFAFAGARTIGTTFPESIFIRDVDEQVTSFLDGPAADPNALFMVFAGANDLVAGVTNLNAPVNRLATDIGRLYDDGARRFFVPNLPRLGLTPRYNDTASAATMNERSETFNDLLAAMLEGLETSRAGIEIFRFDVETQFSQIVADPAYFGFANVSDEAAPGLEPGTSNYNEALIVPEPNTYLFWDDLHPTAPGHALLAEEALRALLPPGDYNRDWVVDLSDYALWRDSLGSTALLAADGDRSRVVDGGDYDWWAASFGASVLATGAGPTGTNVPEPQIVMLIVASLVAGPAVFWNTRERRGL